MKALLADDEKWILQLIKSIIPWDELNLELVAEVSDGVQALQKAKELAPDIIITDIQMPGIDGLELIAKVKQHLPNVKFIIISGHQDFAYAQQAVRLGVNDYILKPIDEDELIDAIIKLAKRIDTAQKESRTIKEMLQVSENAIRQKVLADILYSDQPLLTLSKQEGKKHFPQSIYQAATLKVDGTRDGLEGGDDALSLLFSKNERSARELLCPAASVDVLYARKTQIFIVGCSGSAEQLPPLNERLFSLIKTNASLYSGCSIAMGVGKPSEGYEKINLSFAQSRDAVRLKLIEGYDKLFFYEAHEDAFEGADVCLSVQAQTNYRAKLEINDGEGTLCIIRDEFERLRQSGCPNPNAYLKLAASFARTFASLAQAQGLGELAGENALKAFELASEDCPSTQELCLRCEEFVSNGQKQLFKELESKSSKPISIAKAYIAQNYAKELTLSDVSGVVYLNPAYFSTVFKKEAGMSFVEYLTDYRIKLAKELLRDSNNTIEEIALMVGYKDKRYFSNQFKKLVGINPSEYKKYYYK